jgi:acyl-CoA thioester hydrolase
MSTEAAAQPATIASDRYAYEHVVGPESIDAFRHVNNLVYLEWVLEAATRHSAARGWDVARYDRAGGAWIVRRHEIDYLRQAKEGDRLVVETWVESYTRITAQRMTEVRDADGQSSGRYRPRDLEGAALEPAISHRPPRCVTPSDALPHSVTAGEHEADKGDIRPPKTPRQCLTAL